MRKAIFTIFINEKWNLSYIYLILCKCSLNILSRYSLLFYQELKINVCIYPSILYWKELYYPAFQRKFQWSEWPDKHFPIRLLTTDVHKRTGWIARTMNWILLSNRFNSNEDKDCIGIIDFFSPWSINKECRFRIDDR